MLQDNFDFRLEFCAYWLNEWMNECEVISIVLVHATTHNLQSQRDWVWHLLSPIFFTLSYNALNDTEEFDTNCSQDFLNRLNRILRAFLFVGLLTFGGGGVGRHAKVESLQILDLLWLASLLIANTTNARLGQIE